MKTVVSPGGTTVKVTTERPTVIVRQNKTIARVERPGAPPVKVAPGGAVTVERTTNRTTEVATRGPQGPKGDPGRDAEQMGPPGPPGKDGQIRFTGYGPPGTIVGSEPGDTYMDLATGDVYKLI